MKDFLLRAIAEGGGRALATLVLMPIMLPLTFLLVKAFLWSAQQWTELPTLTNGQILVIAVGIMIFGR